MTRALADVAELLRCPVCHGALDLARQSVACGGGHVFDLARQGCVSLTRGRRRIRGDTPAMVEARDRLLRAGHYDPLVAAVVAAVRDAADGPGATLLDLGGGTGHYAARVLDAEPGWRGVVIDVSAPALRRAARAHPRLAAVGTDAGLPLPLADASVDVVLSAFGPRDVKEIARVLAPTGTLVVASPTAGHLHELVSGAGLLSVAPDKADRLAARLHGWPTVAAGRVRWSMSVDRGAATDLAVMGPTGHHVPPAELAARMTALPEPVTVTGDVTVTTYGTPARTGSDDEAVAHPGPGDEVTRAGGPARS